MVIDYITLLVVIEVMICMDTVFYPAGIDADSMVSVYSRKLISPY